MTLTPLQQTSTTTWTPEIAPHPTHCRRSETHTPSASAETPAFPRARRALIRLEAAHTTRRMIHELIATPQPRPGRQPLFVRLRALTERYEALGGDAHDMLR